MKATLGLLGTLLCGGAVLWASNRAPTPAPQPISVAKAWPGDKFVVHEWGTFTSFSGSNSVKLEFRPLVDSDLPPFVIDRRKQAGDMSALFLKNYVSAMQRMETPVTYFYSDRPRQVDVRVDFPQGLLTEFYPPVEKMLPAFVPGKTEKLSGSVLDWGKVWIVPEDRLQARVDDPQVAKDLEKSMRLGIVPSAAGQPHYAHARETDSALVYVARNPRDPKRPYAPNGAFVEKFLFYRGVGNFELPLKLTALEDGQFTLENLGPLPIRSLFLVTMDDHRLQYAKYDGIGPKERLDMTQSSGTAKREDLEADLVSALTASGLYEKEALAMVKTWRSSWFDEQGTRLFYLLPPSATEALLPLTISPQPEEVVRVMVGRLEIMRPEDEQRIAGLIKQSAKDRKAHYETAAREPASQPNPYPFPQSIRDLGRLAEPALARIRSITRDAEIHAEANQLLWQLRRG